MCVLPVAWSMKKQEREMRRADPRPSAAGAKSSTATATEATPAASRHARFNAVRSAGGVVKWAILVYAYVSTTAHVCTHPHLFSLFAPLCACVLRCGRRPTVPPPHVSNNQLNSIRFDSIRLYSCRNVMNAGMKAIGWITTGSHSMFAETVHSLVDTGQQVRVIM